MLKRTVSLAGIALISSVLLTACDPPMPESLIVAQAELEVQCENGELAISSTEALADLAFTWSDSVSFNCSGMRLGLADEFDETAALILGEQSQLASRCEAFLEVPIAIDAAVMVVDIPDVFEVYLSGEQIAAIFDGSITNWSDPRLNQHNEETGLPDLDIVFPTQATASAKQAFGDWISRLSGTSVDLTFISDADAISDIDLATPIEPGQIALGSFSSASYMGLTIVGIVTEPGDLESLVFAESSSLFAAKSQLVLDSEAPSVELRLDPALEPASEEGTFQAALPYQAIYPLNLKLCGEESTLARTIARFLLRQDSQGVIATATLMPLPEQIRVAAIKLAVVGLPLPAP